MNSISGNPPWGWRWNKNLPNTYKTAKKSQSPHRFNSVSHREGEIQSLREEIKLTKVQVRSAATMINRVEKGRDNLTDEQYQERLASSEDLYHESISNLEVLKERATNFAPVEVTWTNTKNQF